jgi:CRISPR-associated endoribonuclease Cas6
MPTALVFTIRPHRPATVAASLGGATHAAILDQIAALDRPLATQLHSPQGVRPLTVSSVLGLAQGGVHARVTPERTYHLRVTFLSAALESVAGQWAARPFGHLSLGGVLWQVEHVASTPTQHPWADSESYETLLANARRGEARPGAPRWAFQFATPVMFRQRHRCLPLPAPELVFGSLLERWNALAPLPLTEDVRTFAATSLVVNDFDLQSKAVAGKGGVPQIGAVGSCTYTVTRRDPYLESCVAILARFALYSGVGAGTARGFGQVCCRQSMRAVYAPERLPGAGALDPVGEIGEAVGPEQA